MATCGLCRKKLCCPFRKLCKDCRVKLAKADELARLAADSGPWITDASMIGITDSGSSE